MKTASKILKIVGWTLAGIVLLAAILLATLPLWLGPAARLVANAVTPGITKTGFHLGRCAFNPYSGHVEVGDMQLANPTNFTVKNAVELGFAKVDVSPLSLVSETVYVKDITIDGLRIHLDAPDMANIRQIAENVSGPDEAPVPEEETPATLAKTDSPAQAARPAQTADVSVATGSPEAKPAPAARSRIVIDRILLRNVVVQYGSLPIPLPEFEIHDIGRDSATGAAEGATWAEAGFLILQQVLDHAQGLSKGLLKLGRKGVSAVADATTNAVSAGLSTLTNLTGAAVGGLGDPSGKMDKAVRKSMKRVIKETDKAVKFMNGFLDALAPRTDKK